jgi:excisionase family DNA binding protein
MPRTKNPKPEPTPQREPPPAVNGPAGEVLTLAEAAAYLRFSEADVLRLVEEQGLPARRLAQEWQFRKAALAQWLSTPSPPASTQAILAIAGAWKDDPYAEQEREARERRRKRAENGD